MSIGNISAIFWSCALFYQYAIDRGSKDMSRGGGGLSIKICNAF